MTTRTESRTLSRIAGKVALAVAITVGLVSASVGCRSDEEMAERRKPRPGWTGLDQGGETIGDGKSTLGQDPSGLNTDPIPPASPDQQSSLSRPSGG